ncbi:MAG: hypothetical protein IPP41_09420 [Rhodocyclaceae bacterium]|nr:hypothetical protein [Rhodocyclaceae bacterium]
MLLSSASNVIFRVVERVVAINAREKSSAFGLIDGSAVLIAPAATLFEKIASGTSIAQAKSLAQLGCRIGKVRAEIGKEFVTYANQSERRNATSKMLFSQQQTAHLYAQRGITTQFAGWWWNDPFIAHRL